MNPTQWSFENYPQIDWHLLSRALNFYQSLGYQYTQVPWAVSTSVTAATKPHEDESFMLKHGMFINTPQELVGSGEQGFMQLLSNNLLAAGKWCTITPCFRSESLITPLSQNWFMKLELIDTTSVSWVQMLLDAKSCFEQLISETPSSTDNTLQTLYTSSTSADIILNSIEIGSYGIRDYNNSSFAYATGLALPRFSVALK